MPAPSPMIAGHCPRARPARRSKATSPWPARPGARRRLTTRTSASRWSSRRPRPRCRPATASRTTIRPRTTSAAISCSKRWACPSPRTAPSSSPRAAPALWRIVNGEWRLFAEGLFDSLGVVAEDAKGLVVVAGQKAELTRISDTNGDGIADKYETLFDAHSYHANYHSYMHGPVRGNDGSYYFTLNLVHDGGGSAYMGGGSVMGTWGGFNGWAIRVLPNGQVRAVLERPAQPRERGREPRRPRLVRRQPGRLRRHVETVRAQEGQVLRPSRRSRRPARHDARLARDQVRRRARIAASGPSSCSRTTASRTRPAILPGSRRRSSARSRGRCSSATRPSRTCCA